MSKLRLFTVAITLLCSNPVFSAVSSNATPELFGGQKIMQIFLSLIFVVILIAVMAWMLKKINAVPGNASQIIKSLGGLSLGPKERVVLLEVGNKHILIAAAPSGITPLHVFDEPLDINALKESSAQISTPPFAEVLRALKGRDKS